MEATEASATRTAEDAGLSAERVRAQRWLELATALATAFAAGDRFDSVVAVLLEHACRLGDWTAARYFAAQSDGYLRQAAVASRVEGCGGSLLAGLGAWPQWLEAEPVWITELKTDSRVELSTAAGSTLVMPVLSGPERIGVLEFSSDEPVGPDAAFARLVHAAAGQLGRLVTHTAALRRAEETEQRLATTLELAAVGISHVGADGRFLYVNPQLCAMLGYSEAELLARTVTDISHPDDVGATGQLVTELRAGEISSFKREKRYLRKDGSAVWVALTVAARRDRTGRSLYDVSIVEDISARKAVEQRVRYLASHDSLTELPNRATFAELLRVASQAASRHGRGLAVLFIDLDRFKTVNDTHGHEAGDALLREVAGRLKRAVRGSDVVARLGGDEFVVLLQDVERQTDATGVAGSILAALRAPIELAGGIFEVSASIGICLHPDGDQDEQSILSNADMAMYSAKQAGRNGYRLYGSGVRVASAERRALEERLSAALDRREVVLRYVPRLAFDSNAVVAVRAESQWLDAELQALPPEELRAVAVAAGAARAIDEWVLRTACADAAAWQRAGAPAVDVAVSVSLAELVDGGFCETVREQLRRHSLLPERLEINVSADVLFENPGRTAHALRALRALGVKVAATGFGAGRLSFADVARFGVARIELDGRGAAGGDGDVAQRDFWDGATAMGRALQLGIVATGVASDADAEALRDYGCTWIEGPVHGSPWSASDCEVALLERVPS
jgi:diguanylate cyclase (GGDEF)-like protein/PAS domain S-box-containing protein